jgi:pyruvate dehydrogenase E2 component (dihydrolipoamide acetyltransferase)
MPTEVYLVKVGMNMTEGVVEEWYIPDGGTVSEGELLYRLETEKVNLDVDAEATGIVKHLVGEGITKEPGDIVGYIYAEGEAIPDTLPGAGAAPEAEAAAVSTESQTELTLSPAESSVTAEGRLKASPIARRLAADRGLNLNLLQGTGPGGRIVEADVLAAEIDAGAAAAEADDDVQRSSPMARKVARELGVDLNSVRGTGPGGRITKDDVEAAAAGAPAAAAPATASALPIGEDQVLPLRGMRKTIARRMHESLLEMAQLTMDMDVVMDDSVKLRGQLIDEWQEDGLRPTYTDLVIRAVAKALEKHRQINATMTDTEIVQHGAINVGMAVALPEGLIVPVVKNANTLSVQALARETSRLAAAARDGTLTPDDLQGGTFTVTALGMFGVDSFTPIINSPEAGILGVNRIRNDVAWEGEVPVKQQRMKLSLTWDHRVLDGAPAAEFLGAVRDLLEAPYRLLV